MQKIKRNDVILSHFEFIQKYIEDDTDVVTRLAELVLENQSPYNHNLTLEQAKNSVEKTLRKREVSNALITAIALDNFATMNMLPEPLQSIVQEDRGNFGVDEDMMAPAMHLYGSIGWTNAGYLDKTKPGIIGVIDKLGKNDPNITTTFLDDQLGVVVACAAAKIASDNSMDDEDEY